MSLPNIGSVIRVRTSRQCAKPVITGIVTGHSEKDGKPIIDFVGPTLFEDGKLGTLSQQWAWTEQNVTASPEKVAAAIAQIEDLIAKLLEVAVDPISIKVTDMVDIGLLPESERVTIGPVDTGFTTVSHTIAGLILNVCDKNGVVVATAAERSTEINPEEVEL